MDIASQSWTLFIFISAACFIPAIVILYTVVNATRACLHFYLKWRYPYLEFIRDVTVRTATDTKFNQGIITVLLTVKGMYDTALIKERLKETILNRRDKDGKLMFPHLRTSLTQRLGCYAWHRESHFRIENHVVVASPLYRGRLVNDLNIQEHLSDIIYSYLPLNLPPWQVTIIPCYPTDRFYMLIRVHHLLLSEEGLGLGDLLLLGPERPNMFSRILDEDDENPLDIPPPSSPLTGLFKTPVAIPKLYNTVYDTIKKYWDQFVSTYDPVENPEVLKSQPGIKTCLMIWLITQVSISKELLNLWKNTQKSFFRKLININTIIFHEVTKRPWTPQFFLSGIITSLKPANLMLSFISWLHFVYYTCLVAVPLIILCELRALVYRDKSKGYSKVITEATFNFMALVTAAVKELWYIATIIYTAPKIFLNELIISHRDPKHELQTISLCGRKHVAWSEPIPLDRIRRIANSIGASPSEVLIGASSGALREYFLSLGYRLPESVLATARYFPLEILLKTSRGVEDSVGPPSGRGLLCLALPTSRRLDDSREIIQEIQSILNEARERQTAIYEASLWQLDGGYITKILPTLVVKLILNILSRRYAVALTEVAPEVADESRKQLIWGQEVESAMYWRPPQSNICMSLTLMSYGDTFRLGVMADAMTSPENTTIVTGFHQHINMLAALAGIPRDRAQPSCYQPNIPPDGAAMSTHGSNTSVSSASEELRRLAAGSPDLNISSSPGSSRSISPASGGAQSTRSSNDENIFPFTD